MNVNEYNYCDLELGPGYICLLGLINILSFSLVLLIF
jgi:hypothetical protein